MVPLPTEMVAGFLSCVLTLRVLLLLCVCLPDVEASICQRIIHKKVGDTVELSSCLSLEEIKRVTLARWRNEDKTVVDKDVVVEPEFRDRFSLNPTDFSLTVRNLILQDSDDYSFISEVNDKQRETVYITLQVHDPLTEEPILTINSTWNVTSKSCLVSLECSSTYDSKVNYSWSVRNQTQSGSRLQFNIRPEVGETTFTCTISDFISERSTSKTVKCSNSTESAPSKTESGSVFVVLLIVGLIVLVMTPLLLSLLYYTKSKGDNKCCNREKTSVSQEESQQPVYSSLLHGDGSVYESIQDSEHADKGQSPDIYSNISLPAFHQINVG